MKMIGYEGLRGNKGAYSKNLLISQVFVRSNFRALYGVLIDLSVL